MNKTMFQTKSRFVTFISAVIIGVLSTASSISLAQQVSLDNLCTRANQDISEINMQLSTGLTSEQMVSKIRRLYDEWDGQFQDLSSSCQSTNCLETDELWQSVQVARQTRIYLDGVDELLSYKLAPTQVADKLKKLTSEAQAGIGGYCI